MAKMESFRSDYSIKYADRELIGRFWKYLMAYKLQMVFIILTILVISGISIVPPLMVQRVYDILESSGEWISIAPYAIAYVGLNLLLWVFQVVQGVLVAIVTQKVIKRIQMETYISLQEQDLGFFDVQATGEIMSRITNDSQELNNMITVVGQFVSNFVIVFSVLGIMLAVNWQLGLVTLGMGPVVFIAAFMFRRFSRRTSGKWRAAIAEVNTSFQESVSGISVAKAFGREEKSKEEFEVINNATFQIARKRALALTGILARVASQIPTVQSGFAAMERIFSIVDAEKVVKNPDNPVFKEIKGRITFDSVNHEYVPNEPVLKNINVDIKPSESIAIVGHTGAGKTTIASLLMRFYDIKDGSIKIDDVDIRDYDIQHLRSQIGLVSQDVFLFSGTVLDNIRFGRPDATIEEVNEVLDIVAAQEFIDALPDGLETELGERGKGLSAGQRQMISFARTLLTDPKILILDEATAAVDAYTESKIQEALDHLLANRTSIVIAHRLTTIQNSDRILVLDKGELVEEGDHDTLMKNGGLYSELYETYFKHQSAEWISEISEVFSD